MVTEFIVGEYYYDKQNDTYEICVSKEEYFEWEDSVSEGEAIYVAYTRFFTEEEPDYYAVEDWEFENYHHLPAYKTPLAKILRGEYENKN